MNHDSVKEAENRIHRALGDEGRLLLRPSGTEPLVRVMVEAQTDDLCEHYVNDMINVINNIE
ncbi:hypothetical protein MX850_06020 [Erysipelothrix sp. Poltava]|nr:hypothetical protein MX850_06020 [Erysipelothrix sp. Poltava]